MRGGAKQFTHSKLMAWVAADRAVKAVQEFERRRPDRQVDRELRDTIRADILDKGYDPERKTFTQYYGSEELDAAMLMVPMVGFLPPDDERVAGTVAAVERHLMKDGFVQRYTQHPDTDVDGLPPGEGAFLACTFWLADNYALMGRQSRRRERRSPGCWRCATTSGLLSEEYDTDTGRLVGNFPQAFSHVPLIDTARTLSRAVRRAHRGPGPWR